PMSRRASAVRLSSAAGLLGALLLGLLGCAHEKQARLQAEDDNDRDKYEVKTIGDVTTVANANPMSVGGVGVVVNLDGTGGDAPPSAFRTKLEDQLRKKGVTNVKELLASPNSTMVIVSATIPARAPKGDPIDLEITLPQGSKATSLRGGCLKECFLFDYDTAKNLNPDYDGSDRMFLGSIRAKAEGPVHVGVGPGKGDKGDDNASLRRGHVWGGGRCLQTMPFFLVLNSDQQFARLATAIADRVNERFHGEFNGPSGRVAVPKSKSVVVLNVPRHYQHNLPRYLRVVRLIPLRENLENLQDNRLTNNGEALPPAPATRMSYRR